jgi:hypothetical protein
MKRSLCCSPEGSVSKNTHRVYSGEYIFGFTKH